MNTRLRKKVAQMVIQEGPLAVLMEMEKVFGELAVHPEMDPQAADAYRIAVAHLQTAAWEFTKRGIL